MTVLDFRKLIQNSKSTCVWLMIPSGGNCSVDKNSYQIAVELDLDLCEDGDFIFATRDANTGEIKLRATRDSAMGNALTFHGSYEEGIVLEGEFIKSEDRGI